MPPPQTIATGVVVAVIGFFSSFPIVLQGFLAMGASAAQAASGLMTSALAMGLTGVFLAYRFRQPLSVAWSTPGAALLAVLAVPAGGFGEAVGAFLVAAGLVILTGFWRPLARLAAAIPTTLAQAMLAGVLLPICLTPARALPEIPQFIVPIFVVWLIGGMITRLAAVPAAVAVTAVLVGWHGGLPDVTQTGLLTPPVLMVPSFTLASAVGIALPLYIVTMATQNVPGMAILRAHGYTPPPGPLLTSVGVASVLSAPFGAHNTCLAAITSAMCAGEDSHPDRALRYHAAVVAGLVYCLFGLFAGLVTAFATLAPPLVIASLAGIALLGVLAGSLQAALSDRGDRDAGVVTLLITASGITLFDLSAPVWGLAIGGLVHAIKHYRP